GVVDRSVAISSANATCCVSGEFWIDGSARLQIGDGPVPRPSSITLKEFGDLWVADAKRQSSLRPKSPSPDEQLKRRQERKRKGLVIALNTYAKRNNIQLSELEFVEEKEKNQVDGCAALYVHSNFLMKGSDGKHTMFFAEMRPDCTQEEDVVLCTPLEENNYGHCFGCDDRAKELRHPSGGGYLGGHNEMIFHLEELDSDDDCFM
uniref:DUF3615 domain-containing protein n=2 Tax=Triticum urartu TaxID=4572 RepID=A0A8R7RBW7_TRIUA